MFNLKENAISSFAKLLNWLNIKYTNATLKNLSEHPSYPSINSVQDVLQEMNINNLVVRLSIDQLQEIPLPALAHINDNGGNFVTLKEIKSTEITYYNTSRGMVTESLENFLEKWSGVVLLAEISEKSQEPNYKTNHKQELFELYTRNLVLSLIGVLVCLSLYFFDSLYSLTLLIKSVGLLVSLLLLQKQFGINSYLADSICNYGSRKGCDSVIHATEFKLFGNIFLSELSTFYFVGSLLTLTIGAVNSVSVLPYLFVLSWFTLPVMLVSLYYQAFVFKKWCLLCLIIVGVLFSELIVSTTVGITLNFIPQTVYILFLGFTIALIFWFAFRKHILESFKVNALQRRLNHFTKSKHVFQKMLDTSSYKEIPIFPYELITQKAQTPITITLVTSPTCAPCARAHAIINDLKTEFADNINLLYRFSLNLKSRQSVGTKMAYYLFSLLTEGKQKQAQNALTNWYQRGSDSFADWIQEFSTSTSISGRAEELISLHSEWCHKVGIRKTPTLFINGRELPEEFSIDEVKYQVRRMIQD